MLKLKLGTDREPHCSRPGCGERVGSICLIWAYESFEAGSGRRAMRPSWTDADYGQNSEGMRWRAFLIEPGWRRQGEVWRKGSHKRSQRPRITPMVEGTDSYVAPYVAPAMPAIVECPRCRARLVADADDLQVESRNEEDLAVDSGRRPDTRYLPGPTPRMDEEATALAESYIEDYREAGLDPLEARVEYLVEVEHYGRDRAVSEVYGAADDDELQHELRDNDT